MTDVLFAGRAPRLWLRLEQHGDKPFYSRMPRDVIDGFVLNANLIESAPEACAAFLDELGKPFVVDPMSYRLERPSWYSRDRDGQSVGKRNYVRLWGAYTAGIAGFTGDPLRDSARSKVEGEALVRLCQNALEFQELRLSRAWVEDGAQYAVSQPMFGPELTPAAFLAPYVVIGESDSHDEARRAIALAEASAALARPRPVVAVLPLLGRAMADYDLLRSLAGGIAATGVRSVLLWTVGLSALELADSPDLFTGLVLLARNLRDADVEVGMLYGGFLSSLLRGFGVSGFSHALMYGETRGLEPTNGRPRAAFYFPPLRTFLGFQDAERLLAGLSGAEYLESICSCGLCAALVADDVANIREFFETTVPEGATRPLPTQAALDLNRLHFLLARAQELELARERSETELIADLLAVIARYPPATTRTLRAWTARLRSA
jgi:hypothetical protein